MIEPGTFEQFIGTQFGPYRIKQFVAVHHRSPLFLAQAENSAATYLVRLLPDAPSLQGSKQDNYLASFELKASQLAALRHPCLLSLIDYGVQNNTPFLVMPHFAMQSLRAWLDTNGPMDVLLAGRCLDQLCDALAYAHQRSILHESLALDCVYLRGDGHILLANLGLTGLLDLQQDGSQPDLDTRASEGSAPEQLLGKPTGPFTDVYALGAVLYHLLTGEPVFSGYTPQELARQHLYASILPLNRWRPDLPSGLYSIFVRAMAKNPKQRFQQPDALATAFQRVVKPNDRVPSAHASSPIDSVQLAAETLQPKRHLTGLEPGTDKSAIVYGGKGLQRPQAALSPLVEDAEDFSSSPTLKRIRALPGQTALPLTPEDIADTPTLTRVATPARLVAVSPTLENISDTDSQDPSSDRQVALPHRLPRKNTRRYTAVMTLLLILAASGTIGAVLFSRQSSTLPGLPGPGSFFGNSQLLLGLCIALAIAFTVGFNIISRISLSQTKHEYAYTILWQVFCALLVPFFLPFDRFSISASPHVLLLFALSVALWALVDAFLFSSFKYEEASVLSAIFPLNYIFTFAVSVIFFHSAINPTIVIGFLIIMAASLLIGLRYMRVRPSKGIIFALLYSFFQGVALGFNSEVVKSFSIPPYMFAAFLFPAIANLFIFLRPKVAELRHELRVQWKKILLNAAVMDISFFFLLKAFELGNVPQVVALSASSTLLTALAGIVILKEDSHIVLKILAAALATLGIILVQH